MHCVSRAEVLGKFVSGGYVKGRIRSQGRVALQRVNNDSGHTEMLAKDQQCRCQSTCRQRLTRMRMRPPLPDLNTRS